MNYIDLFSGCGGLSLGLKKSGLNLTLAIEKSDLAARTYCYNFINPKAQNDIWWNEYLQKSPIEQYSNKLIVSSVDTILKNNKVISTIQQQNIDLVIGGPPCQGFSLAGKREEDDPRNKLVWDFLDFIFLIKPKYLLIENVVGINRAFNKNEPTIFSKLREHLYSLGYFTQGFEVNAKNYSVPQNRPRMIILGLRKDIVHQKKLTSHIFLNSIIQDNQQNIFIKPTQTPHNFVVKDALDGLYSNEPTSPYALSLYQPNKPILNHFPRKHNQIVLDKFKLLGWFFENNISNSILRDIANNKFNVNTFANSFDYPIYFQQSLLVSNKESFINLLMNSSSKKKYSKDFGFKQNLTNHYEQ